jgi:hypothetical protein
MSKKYNIFGGINFSFITDFKWPRIELSYFFRGILKWDLASWFWFILLTSLVVMGVASVVIQMNSDPTPVMPVTGGWDG